MLRELEKGDVLFAHGIQDADSADALTCQPHNGAPRAAELALERVYLFRLEPVMLFEEPFQNFHEGLSRDNSDCSHDIERRWCGATYRAPIHSGLPLIAEQFAVIFALIASIPAEPWKER